MIRFDISVSSNFKGFNEYTYLDLDDKTGLIGLLKWHWNNTGLTHETGEAKLYASFKFDGEVVKLPLGTFVFYENGDFFIQLDIEFDDDLAEKLLNINYIVDESLSEDEHFPFVIDHIFNIAE